MNINKKNSIWGLSLTLTILNIASLAVSITGLVYVIIAFNSLSDNNLVQDIANQIELGYFTSVNGDAMEIGDSITPLVDLLNTGLSYVLILVIISICANIICFVSGIMGLAFYSKDSKQKLCFGWGIAAAVCSFITIRFVSLILNIVYAAKVHKNRFRHEDDLKLGAHAL